MAEAGAVVAPTLESLGLSRARPLVIVDVDEVLGLFMQGFGKFLESRGFEFRVDRFAKPGQRVKAIIVTSQPGQRKSRASTSFLLS